MDHTASKVFYREIFIEDYSRLLLRFHMVNIKCEMLLTIMTPVVQVSDAPDPIKKKSLGSGPNVIKKKIDSLECMPNSEQNV